MNHRYLQTAALSALLAVTACDQKPKTDPALDAERQRLETEKAAFEKEKEHAAFEKALNEKHAKADAEARKLELERAKLEMEKARLSADQSKLDAEKLASMDAQKATDRAVAAKAEADKVDLEMATAQNADERMRLEKMKAKAEGDRLAAERVVLEARAREAAAKKAQAAAKTVNTVALFYTALESEGEWFDTDRYGYVWRPKRAMVQTDWRPYTDGRWQWTDYGWTWQSAESYGWAVYHYGRWARLAHTGWVWVPGSEWAPAWVSWRVDGMKHVGWAPLPPEAYSPRGFNAAVDDYYDIGPWSYVFLPVADFDSPTYLHKFIPPDQQLQVLKASRNVTHITYRNAGGRSVLVCGGPDSGSIASAIRELRNDPEAQPLPRLQLLLSPMPDDAVSGADTLNAGALMIIAPMLEHKLPTSKPKTSREETTAQVDRGWSGGAPYAELEWRAGVQRDARAVEAAERVAARPAIIGATPTNKQPSRPAAPTPRPTPRPTQTANKPNNSSTPPPQRPGQLSPSRIEPSSPLFQGNR